ncbi:acyl-CoA binding protein, partial [Wilcoxina mikolae CBS 423.85]
MSDSVDRVFAHALQTVRKIPHTGAPRPPPEARLRLYGLYKQSMEGDVERVMPRPPPDAGNATEIQKWDAWYAQRGLSKTEAKRRYIVTLIETMHASASNTVEAKELVSELEFVWDQIRSNASGEEDEEEEEEVVNLGIISPHPYDDDNNHSHNDDVWRGRVEKALSRVTTEVAALREQLENRREERRQQRNKRVWVWLAWCVVAVARHLVIEVVFWGIVILWMRRRGDKRAEEALRVVGRFVKENLRLRRKGGR